MGVFFDNLDVVLRAFGLTTRVLLVSGFLSLVFGTVLAAMRVGPVSVLNKAATVYVTIFRNNPLLVLLFLIVFGLPKLGVQLGFFNMNVLALTLYTSPFICEALRSGVNAVPIGQAEAARSIGLEFTQTMRHVVMPQAFRAVVPPVASMLIALTKNTSLVSIFGLLDLTARMRGLLNDHPSQLWWIFLGIALFYVVLVELISYGAAVLERHWRVT